MLEKGQLKSPIVDGDLKNADWLDDHWMLTAKSSDQPGIIDGSFEDIINSTEVYPGAIGRMDVYFYAYDKRGNQGVGAILNNVQKTEDGERKDGRQSAQEAFGSPAGDEEEDDDNFTRRREDDKKGKKGKKKDKKGKKGK